MKPSSNTIRSVGVVATAALAIGVLSACGDRTVATRLGLAKEAPDEFQVVRRAPLVVPPDFNLRPPREDETARAPGAERSEEARAALIGSAPRAPEQASSGEKALLSAVGSEAEPGIRELIVEENDELVALDESSYLFILDWQDERTDRALDPNAEARRLREAGAPTLGPPRAVRVDSAPIPEARGS